ncbi:MULTISPECIES: hypothetical protein [unclassified Microbacterium]|uniref:hypothetical protein n=1 Tax=unclassified Microbacterium TaxID=2609290 RepID=UPI002883119E|nr:MULTISPECIES: hypothetical protein [unclassified Microbacterium]
MSTPTTRLVTKAEVTDLITFLGANVDVAVADGRPDKADKYRQFQGTVSGLVDLVGELPAALPSPTAPSATDRRDVPVASDDADVHIYFDISGSANIDAIFAAIASEVDRVKHSSAIARRPIMVSFTPFTHEVLPGDHTMKVWPAFPDSRELKEHLSEIPLRSGGTDFHRVWHEINGSQMRSERRNVIVSDLEWLTTPDVLAREQPINIVYAVTRGAKGVTVNRFVEMLRAAGRHESTPIRFY